MYRLQSASIQRFPALKSPLPAGKSKPVWFRVTHMGVAAKWHLITICGLGLETTFPV